jgi:predicted secreted protein
MWWIVFFVFLPIGVIKDENIIKGNDPGAPRDPMLKKKFLYTTLISCILTILILILKNEVF